jgi:hypothetical protein
MSELVNSFQQLGAWRDSLATSIDRLRRWLNAGQLLDADAGRRLDLAQDRLSGDKLVIAFVAEFSRGKSELINAIFFADYGRRILPSAAGRTTMCPTELMYDETLPPCIRALPIETRARLGNTSDFKRSAVEWRVFPLNTDSTEGMLEAFKLVAETVRVSAEEARIYGLYDPADAEDGDRGRRHGMLEISRWRHAIINFPHPLLRDGLVILDTPGLNAIGTEPELTLSLVPSAHAVLFVLAADTGVTRSDLGVWRHIVGNDSRDANHIAILNKIDGLWDELKSTAEIDAEVDAPGAPASPKPCTWTRHGSSRFRRKRVWSPRSPMTKPCCGKAGCPPWRRPWSTCSCRASATWCASRPSPSLIASSSKCARP